MTERAQREAMRDKITYRYTEIDGIPYAYVPHAAGDGITVTAGQDPVSRRPRVLGTAYRTTGRTGRHPRTLLESRGQLWHVPGWLCDQAAVAAIVAGRPRPGGRSA